MKNILSIITTSLLLISCGGSDNNNTARSGVNVAQGSFSLGNPSDINREIANYQNLDKKYDFASKFFLIRMANAVAELVEPLYRGVSMPNIETFSQTTLDVIGTNRASAIDKFQDTNKSYDYNNLLQLGVHTANDSTIYAHSGIITYGLLSGAWIDELDLRYKIYGASIGLGTDTANFKKSYTYNTAVDATTTTKEFIGWFTDFGSLSIRSVFQQTDSGVLTHQESVNAEIDVNAVTINKYKVGGTGTAEYMVAVTGKISNAGIELAARIKRPSWISNIDTGSATNTFSANGTHITITAFATGTLDNNINIRAQYYQCHYSANDCTSDNAIVSGNKQYNISNDGQNVDVMDATLNIPNTLAIPTFTNQFGLDFIP